MNRGTISIAMLNNQRTMATLLLNARPSWGVVEVQAGSHSIRNTGHMVGISINQDLLLKRHHSCFIAI